MASSGGPLRWPFTWAILLFINLLVLINGCLHDGRIGYDAIEHRRYAECLATGHLPTPQESWEYFSPPLPYLVPAALLRFGHSGWDLAVRGALLMNLLCSVGTTLCLLKLAAWARPQDESFSACTLGLLGMLPVYYKTMAMLRGEPYVVFFAVLLCYLTVRWYLDPPETAPGALKLGVVMGLLVLSRQTGGFMLAGLLPFAAALAWRHARWDKLRTLGAAVAVASLVAGWFYLYLALSTGSPFAFNRSSSRFSFSNQPPRFYLGTGDGNLFSTPFRSMPNELLPILYSDMWGDYWGFFLVTAVDTRTGDPLTGPELQRTLEQATRPTWLRCNVPEILPYLGRINLVSLVPTLLFVVGFGATLPGCLKLWREPRSTPPREVLVRVVSAVVIAGSLLAYLGFLIKYPNLEKGDTIKTTYVLHIFPCAAVLGSSVLRSIQDRSRLAYWTAVALLAAVAIHNGPALITHCLR